MKHEAEIRPARRMVSMNEVLRMFGGKSRAWVYDRMRQDPKFPRPVKHGSEFAPNEWFEHELVSYLDALPRQEPTGVSIVDRRRAHAARKQVVA